MDFEWDPSKRRQNLGKHDVDFLDAIEVLSNPHYADEVDHPGSSEQRHVAIGPLPQGAVPSAWSGPLCAVFYTMRGPDGQTYRLISARRARSYEREKYRTHVRGGGPAPP